AAIKALRTPYRFRYSRNLPDDNAWYVQRTRDTHQPRERIELLAQALRRSGVPVGVEYTEPEATFEAERVDKETRRREQLERRDASAKKKESLAPSRQPEPVDEQIAAARAGVARRRARSRALDDVARAAGIEVCPRAIF